MNIVVTGMGMVCPLSHQNDTSTQDVFKRLLAGESGIKKLPEEFVFGFAGYCKIAGTVNTDLSQIVPANEQSRSGRFIHLALYAADQALLDAGLISERYSKEVVSSVDRTKVAVILGAGIGGINETFNASNALSSKSKLSPYFVPSCLINMSANMLSMRYQFHGPSKAVVTACASSAHAIMDAYMLLQTGQVDYVLAGGSEASIYPLGMEGFAAMKALAAGYNDNPSAASRPYDQNRSGFVMGEGAGILVLETEEHAQKRGAKIYATVKGFGASADAKHITNPDYKGAQLAIESALRMANLNTVGHINAHATSTNAGDTSELKAFKEAFGDRLNNIPITATKSAIGHLLGAAGAVEAIISIESMRSGMIPGILNLETKIAEAEGLLISDKVQKLSDSNTVLSTSFGFGGTNAALIFEKYS